MAAAPWDDGAASWFENMQRPTFLCRLMRLPAWKLRLLLEASCWLVAARIALLVVPFTRIARYLGRLRAPSVDAVLTDAAEVVRVRRIGLAVDAAADHLPLPLVCLPRALAGWQMLHRRGIASRLHFGALPKGSPAAEKAGLNTHAWLSCGGIEVTGYPVAHGCVELGYFARERESSAAERPMSAPVQ